MKVVTTMGISSSGSKDGARLEINPMVLSVQVKVFVVVGHEGLRHRHCGIFRSNKLEPSEEEACGIKHLYVAEVW